MEDDGPAVQADLFGVDDVTQQWQRVLAAGVAGAPTKRAGQVVAWRFEGFYVSQSSEGLDSLNDSITEVCFMRVLK